MQLAAESSPMELTASDDDPQATAQEWVDFGGSNHFKLTVNEFDKEEPPEKTDTPKQEESSQQEAADVSKQVEHESPKGPVGDPGPKDVMPEDSMPEDVMEVKAAGESTQEEEEPAEEEDERPSSDDSEPTEKEDEYPSSDDSDSLDANDVVIRRMSHMVTPPRHRKNPDSDMEIKRGNSVILDITSPPDLTFSTTDEREAFVASMNSSTNRRPRGFGTPPRFRPGQDPRKAPSRTTSIDWFKNSRDRGEAHSLTLTEKSRRDLAAALEEEEEEAEDQERETVAVFNANTPEGSLTVRALSKRGCKVIAVVRVFTSRNTKMLLRLPRVTVKVADSHDRKALASAIEGADRAILVTKYWERFESRLEETQADIIIDACHDVGVPHIVFSTFEDIKALSLTGKKSQIVTTDEGNVEPSFHGMQDAKQKAKRHNLLLTHMMTSYLDQEKSKKSLCLLSSGKGKVIVKPYFKDV